MTKIGNDFEAKMPQNWKWMKSLKNENLKMTKIGDDFEAKMPQNWKWKENDLFWWQNFLKN